MRGDMGYDGFMDRIAGTVFDTPAGREWVARLAAMPGIARGPEGLDEEAALCVAAEGGCAWWCNTCSRVSYPNRPCGC